MKRASTAIDSADELLVSPMVRLEPACLHETKRISEPPVVIVHHQEKSLGLINTNPLLEELVTIAVDISWTRDAFDCLAAAELASNCPPGAASGSETGLALAGSSGNGRPYYH